MVLPPGEDSEELRWLSVGEELPVAAGAESFRRLKSGLNFEVTSGALCDGGGDAATERMGDDERCIEVVRAPICCGGGG